MRPRRAAGLPALALAMPFEGTPDVAASWFDWSYDADTMAATGGTPRSVGFVPTAGAHSQVSAWPNSTLAKLVAVAEATGNFTPLVRFQQSRTAFDQPGTGANFSGRTLDAFNRSVGALLIHSGGRDCIVPGYGPVGGWEALPPAERHPGLHSRHTRPLCAGAALAALCARPRPVGL